MLTIVPGLTKARIYDSTSVRYRTRWSPYAFSHKNSGLISGHYSYSPYAFNHKNSGLIHRDFRYSPYAFNHKNSGLIRENSGYNPYAFSYKHSGLVDVRYRGRHRICRPPVVIVHSVDTPSCARSYKSSESSDKTSNSYHQRPISRAERLKIQRDSKKQIKTAKEQDGKDIICRYFNSRNIDDFKMTGMLRIDGRVINVNFLLKDQNLMITYWDLDEVQSLIQQPGYHRTYLERHERQWKNLCNKYTQTGGTIYPITSADEKEILAKLTLCSELNGG